MKREAFFGFCLNATGKSLFSFCLYASQISINLPGIFISSYSSLSQSGWDALDIERFDSTSWFASPPKKKKKKMKKKREEKREKKEKEEDEEGRRGRRNKKMKKKTKKKKMKKKTKK